MKKINILESVENIKDTVQDYSGQRPYLSTGNLQVSEIVDLEYYPFDNKPSRAKYNVKVGDILLAKMQSTTKVKLISEQKKNIMVSSGFFVLRKKDGVDNGFLYQYLKSESFQREKNRFCTGATQKAINNTNFKKLKIPLPDLPTQKAIAARLDQAEAVKTHNQQLLAKYDQLAQSIFLELFGDPVYNQNNFKKGTIRDVVNSVKYGTSKKAGKTGKYSYLRMNNITYSGDMNFSSLKYIDLNNRELPKYSVKKGDILFNRTNSKELVGKTGLIKGDETLVIAGYLIRVRVNDLVTPTYLWAYLNSKWAKLKFETMCKNIVGMANINAQELQDIEILIPPFKLQTEFTYRIKNIEQQKALLREEIEKSDELFQSLLQESFRFEEGINTPVRPTADHPS